MRLTVVNYRDCTRPLDRDRGLIERSSQTILEGWTTARKVGEGRPEGTSNSRSAAAWQRLSAGDVSSCIIATSYELAMQGWRTHCRRRWDDFHGY